ncbi:hypothetical protein [Spiroplasma endosymbiont of Aleiodes alternator]
MNTFLKVFLTQRLQFCVYFILDVQFNNNWNNRFNIRNYWYWIFNLWKNN